MSRYFFNLRAPWGLEQDEIGLDLASTEAAYFEACAAIPDLSAELIRQGDAAKEYAFEVRNAAGLLIWEVPFDEALGRSFRVSSSGLPPLG